MGSEMCIRDRVISNNYFSCILNIVLIFLPASLVDLFALGDVLLELTPLLVDLVVLDTVMFRMNKMLIYFSSVG